MSNRSVFRLPYNPSVGLSVLQDLEFQIGPDLRWNWKGIVSNSFFQEADTKTWQFQRVILEGTLRDDAVMEALANRLDSKNLDMIVLEAGREPGELKVADYHASFRAGSSMKETVARELRRIVSELSKRSTLLKVKFSSKFAENARFLQTLVEAPIFAKIQFFPTTDSWKGLETWSGGILSGGLGALELKWGALNAFFIVEEESLLLLVDQPGNVDVREFETGVKRFFDELGFSVEE